MDENDILHKNFMNSHTNNLLEDRGTEDDSDSDNDNVNDYRDVIHNISNNMNATNNVNNGDTLDLNVFLFDIINDTQTMLDNVDLDSVT